MKTIIFLLSAVLASERQKLILRPSAPHELKKIIQDKKLFAEQFQNEFLNDEAADVKVTSGEIENYVPLGQAARQNFSQSFSAVIMRRLKLDKIIKYFLDVDTKLNAIVPTFIVTYTGEKLGDDSINKSISHNNVAYEVAFCSICYDCCENPTKICGSNHTFCRNCLDEMHKSTGIKTCPNCKDTNLPEALKNPERNDIITIGVPYLVVNLLFAMLFYVFGLNIVAAAFLHFSYIHFVLILMYLVNYLKNYTVEEMVRATNGSMTALRIASILIRLIHLEVFLMFAVLILLPFINAYYVGKISTTLYSFALAIVIGFVLDSESLFKKITNQL